MEISQTHVFCSRETYAEKFRDEREYVSGRIEINYCKDAPLAESNVGLFSFWELCEETEWCLENESFILFKANISESGYMQLINNLKDFEKLTIGVDCKAFESSFYERMNLFWAKDAFKTEESGMYEAPISELNFSYR